MGGRRTYLGHPAPSHLGCGLRAAAYQGHWTCSSCMLCAFPITMSMPSELGATINRSCEILSICGNRPLTSIGFSVMQTFRRIWKKTAREEGFKFKMHPCPSSGSFCSIVGLFLYWWCCQTSKCCIKGRHVGGCRLINGVYVIFNPPSRFPTLIVDKRKKGEDNEVRSGAAKENGEAMKMRRTRRQQKERSEEEEKERRASNKGPMKRSCAQARVF